MVIADTSKLNFLTSIQIAFKEWINNDFTILIYVIKLTSAALLAMSISMFLNLSSPQTSVFTVFIVMQIHSGLVFSKSFYRFLGTLVGFIISLILVSAFSQDRVWFMGFFTIWIAICAMAGFKYRNFMSYGFVLSGYTVAVIVLPNIENPLNIYGISIDRISEVVVGLLSASVISEVIFPKQLSDTLLNNEKQKYRNIFLSVIDIENIFSKEKNISNFSKNILDSDSLRVNSIFESNISKKDKMYYQRLNSEFMHLSITFHSLKNIINTISNNQNVDEEILIALKSVYHPIKTLLEENLQNLFMNENEKSVINKFDIVKTQMKKEIQIQKDRFDDLNFNSLNDFNSSIYLISRFFDEYTQYIKTYISFINNKDSDLEKHFQKYKFSIYTDNVLILMSSFRAVMVLITTTTFWFFTEWEYAPFTIISSVATTLLFSAHPNPVNASKNFLKGAIISFFVAGIYNFYLIPTYVNDVPSFCFIMAPIFAFTAWLGSSPQRGIFAFGFIFIIITVCSMNLQYSMSYISYFETSISSLIGIIVAVIAYELINALSESWTKKRVSTLLTNQIINLSNGNLNIRRVVLESMGLDLIQHFSTHGRLNPQSNAQIFQWLLSSLEIGRAIIDIKSELKEFKKETQLKLVYEILNSIEKYFSQKDSNKQDEYFSNFQKNFIELIEDKTFKTSMEQKRIQNIILEISLIYTLMLNNLTLPFKGEVN